jgi:hypothetical protein
MRYEIGAPVLSQERHLNSSAFLAAEFKVRSHLWLFADLSLKPLVAT